MSATTSRYQNNIIIFLFDAILTTPPVINSVKSEVSRPFIPVATTAHCDLKWAGPMKIPFLSVQRHLIPAISQKKKKCKFKSALKFSV